MNTGAELGQYFCANTQFKICEDAIGLNPVTAILVRQWVSPCPDNKRSGGATEIQCAQVHVACTAL